MSMQKEKDGGNERGGKFAVAHSFTQALSLYSHAALRELHKPNDGERRRKEQKGDSMWEKNRGECSWDGEREKGVWRKRVYHLLYTDDTEATSSGD